VWRRALAPPCANEACQCQRVATCRQQRGMGMRHRAPTGNIPISSLPFSHQTGKTQSNLCASVHWTFQSYPNVLIGSKKNVSIVRLRTCLVQYTGRRILSSKLLHRSENFILYTATPVGEFSPLTHNLLIYLFFGERHSPRSPSPIDLGTGEQREQ
jgi:hypothetical protein